MLLEEKFPVNDQGTLVRSQNCPRLCASGPDQSAVYVTEIFNTGFSLDVAHDSTPIQNEYNEYLKDRVDFKSNSSFAATCPFFDNMSQAQSSKRDYEMQMRQGNNQIVEVEWDYKPEPGRVSPARRPGVPSASDPITQQADLEQGTQDLSSEFCYLP